MLGILKQWLGRTPAPPSADPALIDQLVELAAPQVKLARKYQQRLGPYVHWAEEHAARFTAQWPPALRLDAEHWRQHRLLQLLFANPARMGELIGEHPALHAWFAAHPLADETVVVFTADIQRKHSFGMVEEGGQIRQDVAQQRLQFGHYRISSAVDSLAALQAAGPRRLLEVVAQQASFALTQLGQEKQALEEALLNARTMLRMASPHSADYDKQQARIAELTAQLQANASARSPDAQCERLIAELAATPDLLTLQTETLAVDPLGVIDSGMGDEQTIELSEIVLHGEPPVRKLLQILIIPRSLLQTPAAPLPDVRF